MRSELVYTIERVCGLELGDWSVQAVTKAATAMPGWWTVKSTNAYTRIATPAGYLDFQCGKARPERGEYRGAQLSLPAHLHDSEEFGTLVTELAQAGAPVPHHSTAVATGLRWQLPDRTLLLQRSNRLAWLELRPTRPGADLVPEADLDRIERFARTLHDLGPGPWSPAELGTAAGQPVSTVSVWEHRNDATAGERRAIYGAVLDAVMGVIGGPTLYGGRSDGPEVRWRNANRTLILRGRAGDIRFEGYDTESLDRDEKLEFDSSGGQDAPATAESTELPYLWQLDRNGAGDNPESFPEGSAARTMSQWQDALTRLFTALREQLSPQVGADTLDFQILLPYEEARLGVAVEPGGLSVLLQHAGGSYSTAATTAMRARGWQRKTWYGWATRFPFSEPESASAAAALLVAEAQARGVWSPSELRRTTVSCGARGTVRLTGLGLAR
ncbi:hypothetical protein LTV02_25510 [Nocardia yamanashiensis]|uniref:hypothetical protein n=1 Tax=Nocardia yamanashiensis TaxID=209247 RepID=UPI001E4E8E56|nr:hypothetical protein [Nocardia yamanashiensis]UGT39417.1 hypothetical protein LTV02_25510 [Nocardia yamanashiensis]